MINTLIVKNMKSIKRFILNNGGPLVDYLVKRKYGEHRHHLGNEHKNKIFYVIGQNDEIGGLWWLINKVLMHLWYAEDKGYCPVIDWQNYKTQYTKPTMFGSENVWEYYFEQPCGYSLNDIKRANMVIINKQEAAPSDTYYMGQFYDDALRIQKFSQLFKKYVKFNDSSLKYLNSQKNKYLSSNKKVVGVLCRGTDYVLKKPSSHPIQPEPEDVIRDVRQVMQDYSCTHVFLATEDADILETFKQEFGNSLMYEEQDRLSKSQIQSDEWLSITKKRELDTYDPFISGLKYLTSTYILSQCACFISGRTGGAKGVLIMNSDFEYLKIYDLGVYD